MNTFLRDTQTSDIPNHNSSISPTKMERQQILGMLARMDANMKSSQEMYADMKSNQGQILAKMEANRETDQENLRTVEEIMTANQAKTDVKLKELTEETEKTHMELRTVEVPLDTQAKRLQENLEVITTDLTMVDIEVKTTGKEALEQQRIMEDKTEVNMRGFQAQLEEVKPAAERGSKPATNIQRKYIVERVPAPIRDHGGTQPGVASGEIDVLSHSTEGLPCDLLFRVPPDKKLPTTDSVDCLHDIQNYVRQHLKLASDRMKTRYDKLANSAGYHEGTECALSPNPHEGEITQTSIPVGRPYKVVTRINDVVYRIQRNPRSRMMVIHLDLLAP
jgi:hypothetical protein